VLFLGIASLVCGFLALCTFTPFLLGLPLGIAAFWMSASDLPKMRTGLMDPEGARQTELGGTYGCSGTALSVIVLLLYPLAFASI
jgi:hypothetical protein